MYKISEKKTKINPKTLDRIVIRFLDNWMKMIYKSEIFSYLSCCSHIATVFDFPKKKLDFCSK